MNQVHNQDTGQPPTNEPEIRQLYALGMWGRSADLTDRTISHAACPESFPEPTHFWVRSRRPSPSLSQSLHEPADSACTLPMRYSGRKSFTTANQTPFKTYSARSPRAWAWHAWVLVPSRRERMSGVGRRGIRRVRFICIITTHLYWG